ncbi:Na(+)-translocating NADH-quinone reductase subunit A [Aliiroseovarius sp. S1339]|uniref:Na(+)-translocating NADH-quinone reductase subunit A n=1 Tax=Aliiroseovarius sp. S1339 TaxID=2936990 RepID=UPI0020C0B8A5|nr:Na(+)-translocating NADH-quinone reductase subunit A [Aliiroseovarius sp. S1339]MCK8462484.1 Na(+)-translocating NADH-quinone reductase subunit A [Aliiroseovarius sp. S1339]
MALNPIIGGAIFVLWNRQTGLTVDVRGPVPAAHVPVEHNITEEAALSASADDDLRVTMLVDEDQLVAQGAPIFRLRHHPDIVQVAPMAGRVAVVDLAPGRRLSEIRFFHENDGDRHQYAPNAAHKSGDALRLLLMESGLWLALRSRPFGRAPLPGEEPAAIFIAGLDTKPLAPNPALSVKGREEDVARGIAQLLRLTHGPVYLCQAGDAGEGFAEFAPNDRIRRLKVAPVHPWGLPGFLVHQHHPATLSRPVWDIHLEDVAAIGALFATGLVPQTRLISFAGPAVTDARLLRCQPGADLRSLCYGRVTHGPHIALSGSPLEGRARRWLGARDRQVSVMNAGASDQRDHWLVSALKQASRPRPIIPTAAIERALGGALPALALLRALAVGDRETATRLGALSLVGEDLTLADYVTCAAPRHSALLDNMLREIAKEEAS